MIRGTCAALLIFAAIASSGCAICANPFDGAYAGYGGVVDRADRYHGRVGSAFAPAEAHELTTSDSVLLDGEAEAVITDEYDE